MQLGVRKRKRNITLTGALPQTWGIPFLRELFKCSTQIEISSMLIINSFQRFQRNSMKYTSFGFWRKRHKLLHFKNKQFVVFVLRIWSFALSTLIFTRFWNFMLPVYAFNRVSHTVPPSGKWVAASWWGWPLKRVKITMVAPSSGLWIPTAWYGPRWPFNNGWPVNSKTVISFKTQFFW